MTACLVFVQTHRISLRELFVLHVFLFLVLILGNNSVFLRFTVQAPLKTNNNRLTRKTNSSRVENLRGTNGSKS